MKKIISELARIQQALKAPKNMYNSFGKYHYRNAEGILEAVKPLLNGLALLLTDEPVVIGDRVYIKAKATLTDGDEEVSAIAYAREDETKKGMDGCQVTGACSSYARKYALNGLLMIDDSKDSDDDSLSPKNPANADPVFDKNAGNKASVSTVDKIPAPSAEGQKQAADGQETPGEFLKRQIKTLGETIPGFNFIQARTDLIAAGKVEDVPSATIKMDQAKKLVVEIINYYEAKKAG